jgi:ABC-type transport system involved in multi-copper enzyme maturation permease subunit
MLLHIVRKELLDHLMSLRFALACGLCLAVFLLTSLVLARDYREAVSTYNMNEVMQRNQMLQAEGGSNSGPFNPMSRLWQGVTANRPLNPMNILVRGIAPGLTESVQVRPGGRLDFAETYERNPVTPLFPAVDFVFIVGVIVSLLALAFSYDSISGERESGVLKLLMSYSLPRDQVLLGKWLGGYLALATPFLLSFLVALVLVSLFPEVSLDLDAALGIVCLIVVALLYLGAVYSLGIFVSSQTQLVSTSITVLLLAWVGLILAYPNMAPYIAAQLLPTPSRQSIDRQKTEIERDMQRQIDVMARRERERLGNVWADEGFRVQADSMRQVAEVQTRKVEDSYAAQLRQQTRWAGVFARLSPLTSFNLAAFDLAATGIEQERRFVEALKTYSQTWQAYTEKKTEDYRKSMEQRSRQGEDGQDGAASNSFDLSDYPRFDFSYMEVGERLGVTWLDIGLLGVWNILFFMLAYLSFLRSDIR